MHVRSDLGLSIVDVNHLHWFLDSYKKQLDSHLHKLWNGSNQFKENI